MKFLKKQNIINENSNKKELDIPKPILELYDVFKSVGKKLYLVGGAVRDFVTGETPKDFDLATDATPEEMKNILKNYRINLQGEQFGVIVVYGLDGLQEGVEIATFREDIGRGKETAVKVGASIEMDVQRRDIGFNGLFYDLDKKEVIDLVGGVKDLNDRIVRMIGNPVERIDEDKLRILRVFRFASRYNSTLDEKTSEAIRNNNKLTDVSQERIWEEFNKSFKQAKDFRIYLNFISEFDMWSEIFPGVNITIDDYIETNNIALCFSQIFKNNDSNVIKNKMVKDFESPSKLSSKVEFFMNLHTLTPERIKIFVNTRDRFGITHDEVSEWLRISGLNSKLFNIFIGFEPKVNSKEVMNELGIEINDKGSPKNPKDGQRLGEEINKRIINQFKSLI